MMALLDTGESSSLMDNNIYLSIILQHRTIKLGKIKSDYAQIQTTNGKLIKSKGTLSLNIWLNTQ